MTEKTARQIEAMKNDYNFGVEVEMNHITRQNAAKLAAEFFGTGSYENTAYRNGYMTHSAYDQQGREWKFSRDVSIAGPDDEKCELVTPILGWDDIPILQELLRQLRHAGAISNPQVGAGVHIHVSRKDGFTVNEIKNNVNIMAAHESQIGRATVSLSGGLFIIILLEESSVSKHSSLETEPLLLLWVASPTGLISSSDGFVACAEESLSVSWACLKNA